MVNNKTLQDVKGDSYKEAIQETVTAEADAGP